MSGRGGAGGFTRTAPADLALPVRLQATLSTTDRTEYIDRRELGRAQLMPVSWLERGIARHLPSKANDEPVLTRGGLSQVAHYVGDDHSRLARPA